jgi:hypothetical protein
MYDYRARRSDKIRDRGDDGDTMLLLVDLGMNVRAEESFRLAGVMAPEYSQPGGREAAYQMRLICEDIEERARARKTRWPFLVYTAPMATLEADERRTFTRWVATVYPFDHATTGERSVNEQIAAFLRAHPEWGGGIGAQGDV